MIRETKIYQTFNAILARVTFVNSNLILQLKTIVLVIRIYVLPILPGKQRYFISVYIR